MSFTPEQIQEILDIYFDVVTKRQYLGSRYVPIFGRKDESTTEWDNSAPYEPLTIVTYQGNSYTSRQDVPAGALLTDTDYWVSTGNFNAQVDSYRQDVISLSNQVTAFGDLLPASAFSSENTVNDVIMSVEAGIDARLDPLEAALPISDFDSVNTVKAAIEAVSTQTGNVGALLPASDFDTTNTVKAAITAEATARTNGDTSLNTAISNETLARTNADNFINQNIDKINDFLPVGYTSQTERMAIFPIETGTEGYWYWRKWSDGTAEAWGSFPHESIAMTDLTNGVYFATQQLQEDLPQGLFADVKVCTITPAPGYWGISGIELVGGLSTTKTQGYYPYRFENAQTTSAWFGIEVKGFWQAQE